MRPTLIAALVLLPGVVLAAEPDLGPPDVTGVYSGDIRPYARYCAEIIGEPLPDFDCTADGVEIPVTVHGQPTTRFDSERCDRPSFNGARCRRGARLGSLPFEDPDISAAFICRKSEEDHRERDHYSSVNVIQHNRRNGATCWYRNESENEQASKDVGGGSDGRRAPVTLAPSIRSPVESSRLNEDPPNGIANRWRTVEGNVCHTCHQTDPYLVTPFVAQVERNGRRLLPTAYDGPYGLNPPMWSPLNEDFDRFLGQRLWFDEDSAAAACTTCHALGTDPLRSDGLPTFHPASVAKSKSDYRTLQRFESEFDAHKRHGTFPDAGWMHADGTDAFGLAVPSPITLAAFRQYADCVARPGSAGCFATPIPGRPPTTLRIVEPYAPLPPTLVPNARIVLRGAYTMHDPGDRIRWRVKVEGQPWQHLPRRTRSDESFTWTPVCSPGDRVEIVADLVDKRDRVRADANRRHYRDEIRTFCEGSRLSYWSPRERRLEAIADPARSGSILERSPGVGGHVVPDLLLGDGRSDTAYHSFLTFDIEPPTPGLSVGRAILRLQLAEDRGVVAANLGELQFWHYRFDALDTLDYFAPRQFREGLASTTNTPGRTGAAGARAFGSLVELDVTRHVEVARAEGLDVLQLGAWFVQDTNGDGARDTIRILNEPRSDGAGNVDFGTTLQPVLVVDFR